MSVAAIPRRNSKNSAASVQTTVAMPPIQVHAMATTAITSTDAARGGMPVAASTAASSSNSTTSNTTAVRYTRALCPRIPPRVNSAVVTRRPASPNLWAT
jgi:molybdopterin biosynthesis enzyme